MGVEDEVISIRKKLEKYQEKGKFQNRCFFEVFRFPQHFLFVLKL
jgi:hypothetical protein